MPFERVPPQQDGKFDLRHRIEQGPPPVHRAFGSGRYIAARAAAGETKTHGDDRDLVGIVKDIFGYAQPGPQPLSAGVVERSTLGMCDPARCLTDNQYTRGRRRLNDWFWPKGQIIAKCAFANALDQTVDGFSRDGQPCGARF